MNIESEEYLKVFFFIFLLQNSSWYVYEQPIFNTTVSLLNNRHLMSVHFVSFYVFGKVYDLIINGQFFYTFVQFD